MNILDAVACASGEHLTPKDCEARRASGDADPMLALWAWGESCRCVRCGGPDHRYVQNTGSQMDKCRGCWEHRRAIEGDGW